MREFQTQKFTPKMFFFSCINYAETTKLSDEKLISLGFGN